MQKKISLNGMTHQYESAGNSSFPPVVLLHGSFGSARAMDPIRNPLSQTRSIISLNFRGHGGSAFDGREFTVADLAGDVIELMRRLGIKKCDLLGFSLGAATAFCVAAHSPGMVRRLAMISGSVAWDGILAPYRVPLAAASDATSEAMPIPFQAAMTRLARQPYDWRDCAREVTAETLLVSGSEDCVDPQHMRDLEQRLARSGSGPLVRRVLLERETHGSIMASPALRDVVLPFLSLDHRATSDIAGTAVACG